MLDIAKCKSKDRNSRAIFVQADLNSYEVEEEFDFIFSSTLTHYIKGINNFFITLYGLLRRGVSCVMSVMNPVYTAQYPISHGDKFPEEDEWVVKYLDKGVRSYIQTWIEYNDEITNYLSSSYHYTFSEYINAISNAGFSIKEMKEPVPPEKWEKEQPGRYNAFIETLSYLIIKLYKYGLKHR